MAYSGPPPPFNGGPIMAGPPPPLPTGWSEHFGPQGQRYYHNAHSGQSTYTRPLVGSTSSAAHGERHVSINDAAEKEKPASKEPIPAAEGWFKVMTNLGNVFYTHRASKRSEWTVPEEIRLQVQAMEEEGKRAERQAREENERRERQIQQQRREAAQKAEAERRRKEDEERQQRQRQRRAREEEEQKRQLEQARVQSDRLRILQEANKRKEESEAGRTSNGPEKEAQLEESSGVDVAGDDDEEAWQRQIAADMAAEAEFGTEDAPALPSGPQALESVELTLEQSKEVFMHMLTSLNGTREEVNPMMPWDRELPKFVNLRDYTVLSSLTDREDAFNEWCKARIREKREAKKKPSTGSATSNGLQSSNSSNEAPRDTASERYRALLEQEVTSTRTKWEDFRKTWKRDRRFFAFGRDDREREKAFRAWLKELGEKKRRLAQQAEVEFLQLLNELLDKDSVGPAAAGDEDKQAVWSRAKRTPNLDRDPRYDAVGSSTRRAELFEDWRRGKRGAQSIVDSRPKLQPSPSSTTPAHPNNLDRQRDERAALRAREEQVRRQRWEAERQKAQVFGDAVHDESLREYQQLLIDAVRDPLATLDQVHEDLSQDRRFEAPGLSDRERQDVFDAHVKALNERRLRSLEEVFLRHAPTLDVESDVALPLIKDDEDIERRKLDRLVSLVRQRKTLSDLFEEWNAKREADAKKAFEQMLKENAFIDFWGRLRQEFHRKGDSVANDAAGDDSGKEGEEVQEENLPSLLQMAAKVDLDDVHAILQNDSRYRTLRHRPQLREQMIRNYLQQMDIPKQTVFQKM